MTRTEAHGYAPSRAIHDPFRTLFRYTTWTQMAGWEYTYSKDKCIKLEDAAALLGR